MNLLQLLDYSSIFVTLLFLGISSILDLRTREVPDILWLAYGPIGLALTVARIFLDPSILILVLVSIGLSTLIACGMAYFGLFGGADAEALICISLTIPLPPSSIQPILGYVHPFFPITAIIVSFICSFSTVIWQGSTNLITLARDGAGMFEGLEHEPSWKKALAFVTGYSISLQDLRTARHVIPMEKIIQYNTGTRRKLLIYSNADVNPNEQITKLIKSLSNSETNPKVWVTPELPMLLFILVGVAVTLMLGDPVFKGVLLLAKR